MTDTTTVRRATWTAILLAVAVVVLAGALWSLSPVEVLVNGRAIQARGSESVVEIAERVVPELLVKGDLLDVNGEVLVEGGGAQPRIVTKREQATALDVAWWNRRITVFPGEDVTESIDSSLEWPHFGFQQLGSGALPVVTKSGLLSAVRINVGAESGIELNREPVGRSVEPVVGYEQLPPGAPLMVALTFDDGPNDGETSQILDILAAQGVKATFFVVGENVEKYPELVKREVDEGHQVAVHSFGHPNYKDCTPEAISAEVERCASAVESAAGVRPTWVRPPYGGVDGLVHTHLANKGYRIALWNIDPADYSRPGMQKVINRVVLNTFQGGVVLLHDGGGNRADTIAALPGIIGELRDAGYQFVTVEQLAAASVLP